MNQTKNIISSNLKDLSEFFKSTDFAKAILMGIALTIPVLIGLKLGALSIGITITVGALLASPSDVSGSLRHKTKGILIATLLAMFMSLLGGYLHLSLWILFPVLGILVFGISYISIFGFRASLISFSGLFALVLSFSSISGGEMPPYERALLIGLGGLWYVSLSLLWYYIHPKGPTEYYLGKTLRLTAEYLDIRKELVDEGADRTELFKKLLELQSDIITTHETLRDILISRRTGSGKSDYEGKRLLIFSQLVDMLELAMSNPVNYAKTDRLFKKQPLKAVHFKNLLSSMSDRLNAIADNLSKPGKNKKMRAMEENLALLEKSLLNFEVSVNNVFDEEVAMMRNIFKYQKDQVQKIHKIEWFLGDPDRSEITFINKEYAKRFLTQETYDLNILVENFSLASPIFKHSLRLAVTTMVGYAIGMAFLLQNPYWILLTLIVIMRPTYGLTKTRSRQRTVGTLIGGAIAVGVVLITQNTMVYGILAIVTLVIAHAMIQRNYKASATFITLSVVLIYALLRPDIFNVIQFRIMDTVIAAVLATLSNLVLWPSWEMQGIHKTMQECIQANRLYLKEIVDYYNKKGQLSSKYKISRKHAFLSMSNLSSAFQRMTQEPTSRHESLDKIYRITVLNNTFLSSLASLSTFILSHPTTPASDHFNKVSARIDENLLQAENVLKKTFPQEQIKTDDIFNATYGESLNIPLAKNLEGQEGDFQIKMQEIHMVREQLRWLLAMSEKMPKLLQEVNFKE